MSTTEPATTERAAEYPTVPGQDDQAATRPATGAAATEPATRPVTDPATAGPATEPAAARPTTEATGAAPVGMTTQRGLLPADNVQAYRARWDGVRAAFVDEPRTAVHDADALVGEVLDAVGEALHTERSRMAAGLDDGTSTEDMRQALHRYNGLLDRLLAL